MCQGFHYGGTFTDMTLPLVAGHRSGEGIPSCDGNRTRTVTTGRSRDTATVQFLRLDNFLCPRQDQRLSAFQGSQQSRDVRAPDLIWHEQNYAFVLRHRKQ